MFEAKQFKVYLILVSLIICGLATATVTASKVVHFGLNFPFSNLVFSIFTYPVVDCITEIWGKKMAKQAMWLGLFSQLLIALLLHVSIITPHASFWSYQTEYATILSSSKNVIVASFVAFYVSQLLDITVYQKIKESCRGKKLWLRSNVSTILGQIVDSSIFIWIVFYASNHKLDILLGSVSIKILISICMTPIVYLLVYGIDAYLDKNTQAFQQ
jgi:queuosine precursor transporter